MTWIVSKQNIQSCYTNLKTGSQPANLISVSAWIPTSNYQDNCYVFLVRKLFCDFFLLLSLEMVREKRVGRGDHTFES